MKVRIQQLETGFTRAKRAKMRSVSLILFVIHLIASAGLIHFEIGKVQLLLSLGFEPSHPQRMISWLKTNFYRSPSYSAYWP